MPHIAIGGGSVISTSSGRGMKATFSLEFFGANTASIYNGYSRMLDMVQPGLGLKTFGPMATGPWVAEVTGRHPKYKFERIFLRPNTDYSKANSKGSRGVYRWFVLESGKLYEVKCRASFTGRAWVETDDSGRARCLPSHPRHACRALCCVALWPRCGPLCWSAPS